jgi:hypothetical protein
MAPPFLLNVPMINLFFLCCYIVLSSMHPFTMSCTFFTVVLAAIHHVLGIPNVLDVINNSIVVVRSWLLWWCCWFCNADDVVCGLTHK